MESESAAANEKASVSFCSISSKPLHHHDSASVGGGVGGGGVGGFEVGLCSRLATEEVGLAAGVALKPLGKPMWYNYRYNLMDIRRRPYGH